MSTNSLTKTPSDAYPPHQRHGHPPLHYAEPSPIIILTRKPHPRFPRHNPRLQVPHPTASAPALECGTASAPGEACPPGRIPTRHPRRNLRNNRRLSPGVEQVEDVRCGPFQPGSCRTSAAGGESSMSWVLSRLKEPKIGDGGACTGRQILILRRSAGWCSSAELELSLPLIRCWGTSMKSLSSLGRG